MDFELLFRLIKKATSLSKVRDLLKQAGLPHSARSWDDLIDRRLRAGVKNGQLNEQKLIDLLSESEEYGKQHIFLFRLREKVEAPTAKDLKDYLVSEGAESLLEQPKVLDTPESFTLTDVRPDKNGTGFLLKYTGRHQYVERVGESPEQLASSGKTEFSVRYRQVIDRAIWVARLQHDGLLELRIQSKANSTKYKDDVHNFWGLLQGLLARADFEPVSLLSARTKIWKERGKLENEFRFTSSTLVNNKDSRVHATVGSLEMDLHDDDGADSSIEAFLGHNDAYCNGLNVWIRGDSSDDLSGDIHVIIAGELNEYALPAKCLEQEHVHVQKRIQSLNK